LKNQTRLLLPGLNKQISFLKNKISLSGATILIAGSGSAPIVNYFSPENKLINLIVEDYESLIISKLELENKNDIEVKLMDFERTDFPDEHFDLIYVQGSISDFRRNKIVKELKRICKTNGYLCIGEVVKLNENVPNFVSELFEASGLNPLYINDIQNYYLERKFEIIDFTDLSGTLKEYYKLSSKLLKERMNDLDEGEKAYNKKLLNRISHESNAYLKLGADKFIGFISILLAKK
jgi:SAM-dependent methyltransferase